MRAPQGVVVGIDISESSDAAAQWALEEARRRGVALTVVHVWQFGLATAYAPFEGSDLASIRQSVQITVDRFIGRLRRNAAAKDVSIQTLVIEGDPGPSLVAAAAEAELLVVGSHGHGAVARAVLGSVSTYSVHHATCTTVVVPTRLPAGTRHVQGEAALVAE